MPSVSRYRTWLAVPADEIEDLKKAHPPMNGHTPVIWDKEHKLWFARPGADLSRLDRWLPRPQDVSMNGSDPVTEFAQVLENAGLVLKELPVMDGKIHRVPTADDKKGQKSGAYRGFLDGRPAGWYRDYRSADDSPITWTFSGGEQTDPRARLHLKAHSMQRREDAERELKAQYNRQAAYARRYVNKWPQATAHEYLTRKGIQAAPGVRVNNKNELVIPFSNRNGAIRSYQRIPVTGGKDARILKDSEKTGNWFALGTPRNGQPVLFAEGYATAASLHEATGLPVLMTVDGGNMIAVAENARQKWTQSPFIFCADNDHAIRVNGLFRRVMTIARIFPAQHVRQRVLWQTWTAFCQDVSAFVAIAHICGLRCVVFGEDQVTNNAESRIFPGGHKAIDAVPAVEADHQRIFFEYAEHFITGRLQPFIGFIAGNGTP